MSPDKRHERNKIANHANLFDHEYVTCYNLECILINVHPSPLWAQSGVSFDVYIAFQRALDAPQSSAWRFSVRILAFFPKVVSSLYLS